MFCQSGDAGNCPAVCDADHGGDAWRIEADLAKGKVINRERRRRKLGQGNTRPDWYWGAGEAVRVLG